MVQEKSKLFFFFCRWVNSFQNCSQNIIGCLPNLTIWCQILILFSRKKCIIKGHFLSSTTLKQKEMDKKEREKRMGGRRRERKTSPLPPESTKTERSTECQHYKAKKETYHSHCPTCFRAPYLSGWGLSWTDLTGRSCGLIWPPCPKVSWHALGTSLLHFQYQHLTLHW